jgi:head-tail adaptor
MVTMATPTTNDLRERVELQSATVTIGADFNEEILAWATVATVWAQVVERGGREPILADRPVMVVSYEVTIRAITPTPTHLHRLLWRTKVLSIEAVTPLPSGGLLVLRCLEASA